MRYCIISDIHSNLSALEAVLSDADKNQIDEIVCLGDIIDYGPNPIECLNKIFNLTNNIIVGNHDWAVTQKLGTEDFNEFALFCVKWTQNILSGFPNLIEKINLLPEKQRIADFEVVHGALTNPITDYLINIWVAVNNFKLMSKHICFNGHTHLPIIFYENTKTNERKTLRLLDKEPIELLEDCKYLINPGSVGQPRDNDPRASYIIYDTDKCVIICRRVNYDIPSVQLQMQKNNFPEYLIQRLAIGK